MFGTALRCLQDHIVEKYGQHKWQALLQKAGFPPDKAYSSIRFYPDSEFERLVNAGTEEFKMDKNMLLRKFGKLFGEHLLKVYGRMFLKNWKSLEIVEKVAPKVFVTIQMVDPYTPKSSVKCERVSPDEVIVHYQSPRKMCVYISGIIDAVGEHFKEKLELTETQCMHQHKPECEIHVKRKGTMER